jgi:hypothetical protein
VCVSKRLEVAELICTGPLLSENLIRDVDRTLSAIGWTIPADTEANVRCTVNHTPCYCNAWTDGMTLSDNPATRRSEPA